MNPQTVLVGGTSKIFHTNSDLSEIIPSFVLGFNSKEFQLGINKKSNYLISFNHNPKLYKRFIKNGGETKNCILIRLEPDSVFPAQYTNRITKKYGLVISPGGIIAPFVEGKFFGWPYSYHLNPAEPAISDPLLSTILGAENADSLFNLQNWNNRKNIITLIAANKVSATHKANYAVRRKLAMTMPSSVFAVYGPLWTGPLWPKIRHRLAVFLATIKQGSLPNLLEIYGNLFRKYPNALGPIENKHNLMRDSKFALVVENSNAIVTEKIFDAIINGAIPLYIGPNLEFVGLPPNLVISISGNPKEIIEAVNKLEQDQVEAHLKVMMNFTRSKTFLDCWTSDAVNKKMTSSIIDYMKRVTK